MADSFDVNIARRKPNVLKKPKPIHPWDVPPIREPATQDVELPKVEDSAVPTSETVSVADSPPKAAQKVSPTIKKTPQKIQKQPSEAKTVAKTVPMPHISPKRDEGLSNSINIHSNFCKLDNDVSDKLLPRLSPSAQSVYLRLYRQSYGWNRNWASESLPKLAKSCNQSLQTIRKAIKELENLGCISKEMSDYHRATVYKVYLPSEIEHDNNLTAASGMSDPDSLSGGALNINSQNLQGSHQGAPVSVTDNLHTAGGQNLEGSNADIRGQESATQSLYFAGTSIYVMLESGGASPININKYIIDKHLGAAVETVDEFYNSIGFSVVSRAQYRKSIFDYLELVDSGFSVDDIKYAVRWTFMNSRTRPEGFSLIKHTMHLAMNDLIQELKSVSGEKADVKKKQAALNKNRESADSDALSLVSAKDLELWKNVLIRLEKEVNDHSYKAFIETLTLKSSENGIVTLSAPSDSISWIDDHYRLVIEKACTELAEREMSVKLVAADS